MIALQSHVRSRVLPLQSEKSGNVAGGSKPSVSGGCPVAPGPWQPMDGAAKISLPVSSFNRRTAEVDCCASADRCALQQMAAIQIRNTKRRICENRIAAAPYHGDRAKR